MSNLVNNDDFFSYVALLVSRSDSTARTYSVLACEVVLQNLDNSPFHPWFLEQYADLTCAGDSVDNTVALPSDFLDFKEDGYIWYFPVSGDKSIINRGFLEDLEDVYANQDAAHPVEACALAGSTMYLGPTPDEAGHVKFWYTQSTTAPADITTAITNPWILNAADYVAHRVAEKVARDRLRNPKRADELMATATTLRTELFRMNEGRKHSNMDYEVNN